MLGRDEFAPLRLSIVGFVSPWRFPEQPWIHQVFHAKILPLMSALFSPTIVSMSPQKPSSGREVIDKEVAGNDRGHHPMNMMWAVSMIRQYDHMVHMVLETSCSLVFYAGSLERLTAEYIDTIQRVLRVRFQWLHLHLRLALGRHRASRHGCHFCAIASEAWRRTFSIYVVKRMCGSSRLSEPLPGKSFCLKIFGRLANNSSL